MSTAEEKSGIVVCQQCGAHARLPGMRPGLKYKCPKCGVVLAAQTAAAPAKRGVIDGAAPNVIQPTGEDLTAVLADVPMAEIVMVHEPVAANVPVAARADEFDEIRIAPAHERVVATELAADTMLQAQRDTQAAADVQEQLELPDSPLIKGVINFPAYPGVWTRGVGLMIWLAVVLWLIQASLVTLAMGGFSGALAIFCVALASLVGMLWFVFAAGVLLAIFGETAEGADTIETWPTSLFPENWLEPLILLNALALAALPGFLVGQALGLGWAPLRWLLPTATIIAGFPPLLMSMMAGDSPLAVNSPQVWRSIGRRPEPWLAAYGLSLGLLVIPLYVAALLSTMGLLGPIVAAAIVVAVMLVYFRMLGRLANLCATWPSGGDEAGSP